MPYHLKREGSTGKWRAPALADKQAADHLPTTDELARALSSLAVNITKPALRCEGGGGKLKEGGRAGEKLRSRRCAQQHMNKSPAQIC